MTVKKVVTRFESKERTGRRQMYSWSRVYDVGHVCLPVYV